MRLSVIGELLKVPSRLLEPLRDGAPAVEHAEGQGARVLDVVPTEAFGASDVAERHPHSEGENEGTFESERTLQRVREWIEFH